MFVIIGKPVTWARANSTIKNVIVDANAPKNLAFAKTYMDVYDVLRKISVLMALMDCDVTNYYHMLSQQPLDT